MVSAVELRAPLIDAENSSDTPDAADYHLLIKTEDQPDPQPRRNRLPSWGTKVLGLIGVAALLAFVVVVSVDSDARDSIEDPFTTSDTTNDRAFNIGPPTRRDDPRTPVARDTDEKVTSALVKAFESTGTITATDAKPFVAGSSLTTTLPLSKNQSPVRVISNDYVAPFGTKAPLAAPSNGFVHGSIEHQDITGTTQQKPLRRSLHKTITSEEAQISKPPGRRLLGSSRRRHPPPPPPPPPVFCLGNDCNGNPNQNMTKVCGDVIAAQHLSAMSYGIQSKASTYGPATMIQLTAVNTPATTLGYTPSSAPPRLARGFSVLDNKFGLSNQVLGYTPYSNGTFIGIRAAAGSVLSKQMEVFTTEDYTKWNPAYTTAEESFQMIESPCIEWRAPESSPPMTYCPAKDVSIEDWWQVGAVGPICGDRIGSQMPNIVCQGDKVTLSSKLLSSTSSDDIFSHLTVDTNMNVALSAYVEGSSDFSVIFMDGDSSGGWTTLRTVMLVNTQQACALAITQDVENKGPVFTNQNTVRCLEYSPADAPILGSVFQVRIDPWSLQNSIGSQGWTTMQQYGLFPFSEIGAQLAPVWKQIEPDLTAYLQQRGVEACNEMIPLFNQYDLSAPTQSDCVAAATSATEVLGVLTLPLQISDLGRLVSRRANVAMISAMCHPDSGILHLNSQLDGECKKLGITEQSWYSDYSLSDDLDALNYPASTTNQNLFDLANLAVGVNLQNQDKMTKQCPFLDISVCQSKTKSIWGTDWGHATQTQLRNDALNLMCAGRPAELGLGWYAQTGPSYFAQAGAYSVAVAGFMQLPIFSQLLYSAGKQRHDVIMQEMTHYVTVLNHQVGLGTNTASEGLSHRNALTASMLQASQESLVSGYAFAQRLNPDLNDEFMTQAFQYGIDQVKSNSTMYDELKERFEHAGGIDQAATLLLKARAFMTGKPPLSFSEAAWKAINPEIKDPAPSGFKTVLGDVGTLASVASFGLGVAQLASEKGKCEDGTISCIKTYAGDVKDGLELLEPALKLIPQFNEGLEAFEATAKTEAFGTILIHDSAAGFEAMKSVVGGMLSTGVELAKTGDLISIANTASSEVGAAVSGAVTSLKFVGELFGTVVDALGIVGDLLGGIVDGIDAVKAFAEGGEWNDIDGAMDVVESAASFAVLGSAMLVGLSNPVTLVLDAVVLGVALIAWLIDLFKPKPLNGPDLVAIALTSMGICTYSAPKVGCFPAHSTVLSHGHHVLISSLQLGSPVLSVAADGSLQEKSVHFFGHKDSASTSLFYTLHTESGHALSLTGDHLVPTAPDPFTPWDQRTFKRAHTVDSSVFVWVLLEDNANGTIGLSQIARTSAFRSQGLYNPYSENGHTIVNNVVASDHSAWVLDSLISDKNAHIAAALYAPLLQNLLSKAYRVAPGLVESINECYYVAKSAGASMQDAMCTIRKMGIWVAAATVSMFSARPKTQEL